MATALSVSSFSGVRVAAPRRAAAKVAAPRCGMLRYDSPYCRLTHRAACRHSAVSVRADGGYIGSATNVVRIETDCAAASHCSLAFHPWRSRPRRARHALARADHGRVHRPYARCGPLRPRAVGQPPGVRGCACARPRRLRSDHASYAKPSCRAPHSHATRRPEADGEEPGPAVWRPGWLHCVGCVSMRSLVHPLPLALNPTGRPPLRRRAVLRQCGSHPGRGHRAGPARDGRPVSGWPLSGSEACSRCTDLTAAYTAVCYEVQSSASAVRPLYQRPGDLFEAPMTCTGC